MIDLRSSASRLFSVLFALVATGLGCAGSAWEHARTDDTAAAYAAFLRDHPNSEYSDEARARSALTRVRKHPTPAGFEAFREKFADSGLVAELRPHVEGAYFDRARATGTAEAYRHYLDEMPDSSHHARALGNAEYLEADGFAASPDALRAFAASHPESDFAREAKRSADAVAARGATRFDRVGLVVDVSERTPGGDRVARHLRDEAMKRYASTGLTLVPLSSASDPRAGSMPAILSVVHDERAVRSTMDGTTMRASGLRATTTMTLTQQGDAAPIWQHSFELWANAASHKGVSILFGAGTQTYWSEFFVPFATWSTQLAVRKPTLTSKPPVALEVSGTRALVLFENGDFEIYDLADPSAPLRIGRHRRSRNLEKFGGLRLVGDQVAIFGEDGLEIVSLGPDGPKRLRTLDRSAVGSIVAVERVGDVWIIAGNRGMLMVPSDDGAPDLLLERNVLGLARRGDRLLFSDGVSLFASTVSLLREKRVEGELRLGSGFGPGRLRLTGNTLVVLGERGVVRVDVSHPRQLRTLSRIDMTEVGEVRDALWLGGRLFLLGQRGLQLTDAQGERVVDSADVVATSRLGAAGRHLILVGQGSLQVVDSTPFALSRSAAAPE
jgi:hypothetical protein